MNLSNRENTGENPMDPPVIQMLADIQSRIRKIEKKLVEIEKISTAPRAVPIIEGEKILVKLAQGDAFLIVESNDRLIGPHLIMNGVYEKGLTTYLLRSVEKNSTFIDIGANIGYYTCLLGKKLRDSGRIFAFEADPKNHSILKRNMQINWIDKSNIIAENVGISDKKCELTFYRMINKPGNSSFIPQDTDSINTEMLKLNCTSIDDYFSSIPGSIDFMKIDVEGAEFSVLLGGQRTLGRQNDIKIILEWDPARWTKASVSVKNVRDLLESLGFIPHTLDSKGEVSLSSWDEITKIRYANLIFSRTPIMKIGEHKTT